MMLSFCTNFLIHCRCEVVHTNPVIENPRGFKVLSVNLTFKLKTGWSVGIGQAAQYEK